jgi:type II secretory pathway component PulC
LPALPLLSAKLLGTMLVDDAQADLAKAFILDTLDQSRPSVLTLIIGDPLQGRRLTQIERGLIRLRQPNGMEEQLKLAESPTDGAIHEVGPDVYQVDRRLMTRMLKGDANNLRTQAIIHPHIRRFQLTGFKLARVEPESLVDQAGLERNDVITAVGERKLNSVSAALTAYQEARESHEVAIEVTRGGRPRTLRYYLN